MSKLPDLRILLLTPQLPYPPQQGTSLRNFHILRGLAQQHEVHLVSFTEGSEFRQAWAAGDDPATVLGDMCATLTTVPAPQRTRGQRLWRLMTNSDPDMAHRLASKDFANALDNILSRIAFDVVQVEGIELAALVPQIRRAQPGAVIVFDDHNAEAELQRRTFATDARVPSRWIGAAYSFIQWRRLRRYERWVISACDGVSVVSEADRRHLQALDPDVEPVVIPNCIDVASYANLHAENNAAFRKDILFVGKMDYRPNVDAVLWFAREIWPFVQQAQPQVTWAVVGKQPHRRLDSLKETAGVTVTGEVPDVKPYLAQAQVYIMPFRIGSGTRLKLIEALASGVATVSTRVGAEGYPLEHDKQLLLQDEPGPFAEAVLCLLQNSEKRKRLQEAGRQFAKAYDWRRVVPRFNDLYARLLSP